MTLKPSNCRSDNGSERTADRVGATIAKAAANANEAVKRTL